MSSNIIVVIDHADAKVLGTTPARIGSSAHDIAPNAPQQFHHSLDLQEHDADREEKYPQDTTFVEQIAVACKAADRIVLIGRGHGQSNEARHLIAYLAAHHSSVASRLCPPSPPIFRIYPMARSSWGTKPCTMLLVGDLNPTRNLKGAP